MKKVLCLSLVASSMFSMQLDRVKSDQKPYNICIEQSSVFVPEKLGSLHDKKGFSVRQDDNKYESKKHFTDQLDRVICIEPSSVFVPEKLGSLQLYHEDNKGFFVYQNENKYEIKHYFTDKIVRNITKEQLKSFLKAAGYFSLNQMSDGEYSLKANGRINGGGPILGVAAYWVTKSFCYAVGLAAIGGTVATTAGAGVALATYGVATAGGIAVAGAATTTTATAVIGTTAGAVVGTVATGAALATGAGIAGGAIGAVSAAGATVGGMSLTAAAATTTAAAVTATGSVAATIAGVEAVSLAVGSFFGMLPTP